MQKWQNKYNTEVIAYNNTLLKEFGNFFDIYDMKFNAQDIKISVDYPLIFGDNDLNGLYYIKNYLEIIELENKFCNHFKSKEEKTEGQTVLTSPKKFRWSNNYQC